MYSTILVEKAEGWLDIWLNRPTFRNALSTEMVKELLKVLNITKKEGGIRGITLRGKDNIFCAGGDLKGFKSVFQNPKTDRRDIEKASVEI